MKVPAGNSWEWTVLEPWRRDLRSAARGLWRAPGFSIAVFCSLVVCLGPNAATLSALYALVLKPLPFSEPAQLVTIVNVAEKSGGQLVQSSTPQYRDFKARADLFSSFAVIRYESGTLDEESAPSRVANDVVSAGFFSVLGVRPVVGRFFTADEEVEGRDHVLVLSQNFWESRFHADANVIGSTVRMDGQPYAIVGVAPRSLECLHQQTSFFKPYAPAPSRLDPQARYRGDVALYARLKPGVSVAAGLVQLTALEMDFRAHEASPQLRAFIANAGYRLAVEPLRTGGAMGGTNSWWLLQGGALLVLLIGCVNVVNLFLARMNAKRGELAIRVALGAGRAALLRQMLAESLMLTGAAAAAGIGLAMMALRVFNRYLPVIMPAAPPVTLDATVACAIVAAACGIALLVGFLPLQLLWRTGLRVGESRTASSSGGARAVSSALVTVQVAVAVVLLVGASLLLRSFANVMAVDPGFDAAHVVKGQIVLPSRYAVQAVSLEERYRAANAAENVGLQRRILESLKTIAGVENVAESRDPLLVANVRPVPFSIRDEPVTAGESQPLIHINAVSPDFFATMGMRILSGRGFDAADDFSKAPVAIVDQTFVERYFPGQIVEGHEIYLSRGLSLATDSWPRIVGVVSRANLTGLDSHDNLPVVFVPLVGFPVGGFDVLVRSPRPASEILRGMRAKLHEIDPTLPLYSADTLEAGLDNLLMTRRGITLLLGVFSGLALLLASIGLYGVLSYDVSQRTREIGIRGAIGASRGQIVGLILRQGMGKTGVGLAAGLLGALFLTRYLSTLLFGIISADPVSYLAVLTLLAGVSLLACWLPARRAARVDPIVALRAE